MSSESISNEFQNMINVCFNNTNDIIFFINEESSIIFSNTKAIDRLGYSEEELKKKKIYEIASSKHRSRLEKLSKNIPKKGQFRQELELSCCDGSIIYTENVIMPVYDSDDSHLHFVCKFRDISKQIAIKQSLNDERNLTESVLSTIGALIVVLDSKGRIVRFNRFCELLTGYDFKEVLGKKMVDIFLTQEEKNGVQKHIENIKHGSFSSSHTNHWLTKKGEKKLISWNKTCITDENGNVTHIIETGIDITEKEETEKDLDLKADLLNSVNDSVMVLNLKGAFIYVNETAHRERGYTREEMLSMNIVDFIGREYRDLLQTRIQAIVEGKEATFESQHLCKDGSFLEIEFRSKLIEIAKEKFILSVGRDISKRKQSEEELKSSEEKYRLLFSEMSSAFAYHKIIYDKDGKPIDFEFLRVNHSYEKILNLTSKEIIGKKATKIFPMIASGENNLIQKFGKVAKFGKKLQSDMFFKSTKKWYSISAYSPEKDHFAVIFEDITTRKNTEKELRLKDQAITTSINAIAIGDLEANLVYINLAFLNMWGFSDKTEVLGRNILEFWHNPSDVDKVIRALQTQSNWLGELVVKKKDGTLFDVQLSASMVFDEEGVPSNMLGSFIDITERKKTEKRMKESERRIRQIMEGVPIGITLADFEGNIFDANSVMWKMLGLESKEAFIQTNATEFYYDQKDRKAFVEQLEIEGKVQELICQIQRKDGSVFWGSLSSVVESSVTGERRLITTLKDITERKKAEEELRKSEYNLRERVKEITSLYLISEILTETKISYEETFNRIIRIIPPAMQYPEITMARIAYIGKEYSTADFEESHWKLSAEIIIDGEKQGELEVCYSKEKREEDEGSFLKEERDLINAIANEIARFIVRKKYEEELILKNYALETSPIGLSITNHRGIITYVNPAFKKIWRYSEIEESLGKRYSELIQMLCQNTSEHEFLETKKQMEKEGFWKGEFESKALDGTPKWVNMTTSFIYDEAGNKKGILTFFEEITEKKKAEKALEESEELLLSVINNSPFGYSLEDNEGKILRVNPALTKMLGYTHEELLDIKLDNITPDEYRAKTREITQKIINREVSVGEIEKEYISKDGTLIPVRVSIWQIYDAVDKPAYFVGLIEDITDRKKNEREREETFREIDELNEQLKVINTILRHDIRNNLVITNGSIDAFLDSNKESFLHMAKKTTTKSENLIDKMKEVEEIITKGERELVKVDARNIAEEVISTYAGIGIQFDLKGKGSAQADAALGSVIDNIIGNALKHSETDMISITIKSSKDSCVIAIADNGKGIPDDFKKKLFEHNFRYGSTAGTGLGLYIVKKTIDQYGGSIKVKNNLPKGTIFEIELKKA